MHMLWRMDYGVVASVSLVGYVAHLWLIDALGA
jgi:hypothetical protein